MIVQEAVGLVKNFDGEVEVLTTDGSLVRSQQPALQKWRDTMNPRKKSRGLLGLALHDASRVAIAVLRKRSIGLQPITHSHTALLDRLPDEARQAVARPISDPLQANASNPFAANLSGHDHPRFVSEVPTLSALFEPADTRLVDFDLTGERLAARPHPRTPQCVQPGPRRLVTADSHHAVQAVRVNLSARDNVGLVLPLRPGETCEGGAKR